MEKTAHRSYACLITLAAAVALGLMAILPGWPMVPAGLLAYLVLALLPGALIYRTLADKPGVLETILAATALSPVLTAAGGVIAMLLGFDARVSALALLVITGGLGLAVCFFNVRGRPRPRWELGGRQAAVLLGFIAIFCAAISIPAFANEWWRLRSDAWFHGGIIYEILEYGIPPQDPYFVGLPLQYMWFFRVYIAIVAEASGIGPFIVMTLFNIQAIIAYALAIFLAAFQAVRLFRSRQSNVWLLLCTTAAVFAACALVNLPSANSYDKLPFLIFFPLAVLGGWTIAEFAQKSTSVRTQWLRFAVISFVAFAPLNLFMLAAYYHTAPILQLDDNEKHIMSWVRDYTPRHAVFFDNDDRVFLLVPGPRRYYAGSANYAMQWGYDDAIIDARFHVRENHYSSDDPDALTLKTLGSINYDVYVILRSDEPAGTIDKFESLPELFEKMHSHDAITLFKVNRPACRDIADALGGRQ